MSQITEVNARQLIAQANARNVGKMLDLYAEDATFQVPGLETPLCGKEAIRAFLEGNFTAFPDWRMEVSKVIVSGGETIIVNSIHGTLDGTWARADGDPVAPTHRRFTQDQLTRVTFNAQDKVQTIRSYGNLADTLRQLGLSS